MTTLFVHAGAPRHGVHRFGVDLARAVAHQAPIAELTLLADLLGELGALERAADTLAAHPAEVVVLQFTDQLYATDAHRAEQVVLTLVDAARPAQVVVVPHDLPTAAPHDRTRGDVYRTVTCAADTVVVCSAHERRRLEAVGGPRAHVVPLPITPDHRRPRPRSGTVTVAGYLYPGKGHDEVIAATAQLRPAPPVRAAGGPAPRHPELAEHLVHHGAAHGVDVQVTGWLDDDELHHELATASVAVVPGTDISASASLASWIGAGRRPLVRAGAYTAEVAELAPGCVQLYAPDDPEALAAAIGHAHAHPRTTVHAGVPAHLHPHAVARAHLRCYGAP